MLAGDGKGTTSVEDLLSVQYRRRFEAEHAGRLAMWRALVDAWFSGYLEGVHAVLDLGCGRGEFINQIEVPTRYALDLNPDATRHLDAGVELISQQASERWPLPDGSLDLVFTSNFLEHLASREDVSATLAESFRSLRVDGRMICLGPNIRYARGAYWDFFDHVIPLTERSLVEALELSGFRTERVIGRFLPYTTAGKRPPHPRLVHAYLRLRPVWRLVGRQFLVVARKPPTA
jgi:SAM-dependent methyltransferase